MVHQKVFFYFWNVLSYFAASVHLSNPYHFKLLQGGRYKDGQRFTSQMVRVTWICASGLEASIME